MPFSLRLDSETEARIRELVSKTGWSKASIVREAVAQYRVDSPAQDSTPTAYDRLKPYIGVLRSGGRVQASTDTHAKYRAALRRKHGARRSR